MTLVFLFTFAIGNVWADTTYKLFYGATKDVNGTTLNSEDFFTTLTSTEASHEVAGTTYAVKLGYFGGGVEPNVYNKNTNRFIRYDVKTTSVEIEVVAIAKNKNRTVKIGYVKEPGSSTTASEFSSNALGSLTLSTANTGAKSDKISFTTAVNASIIVSAASSATDIQIIQVTVTEKGTPLPKPGDDGYAFRFQQGTSTSAGAGGRHGGGKAVEIPYEGGKFVCCLNSEHTAGTGLPAKLTTKGTHYIKFTTAAYSQVNVAVGSSNAYYIADSKNPSSGTTYTADASVEIDAGTWYIVPNGSDVTIKNISFEEATPATKHHVTYSLGGDYGTTPTQADVAEGAKFNLHNGTTGITAPTGKQFGGWNDGTTTYAGGAEYTMGTDDVELTAVWETAKTNPTATFSNGAYVVGASALDLSSLWTDATSDGAVTYALKVASDDATVSGTSFTATKAGSYVVVATQAATSTYNALVKEATITVTWPATGAATITYEVKVGTGQTTLDTNKKEANSASISNLVGFTTAGGLEVQSGGGKTASSPKIATPTAKDDTKYVYVTFDVASGYIFTINSVTTKMVAVSKPCDIEVELSDATTNEALSYNQTNNNDPGADHEFEFAGKAYEGTVTLKIYAYGVEASSYRIGKPLTISGTVAVKPSPSAPSITAPTEDQTAVYDINDVIAPLTITATGYPAPTYQWYKNSTKTTEGATAISGAESASYTPANDVASDLYYYCVLTNSQGTATSHYFHVTVNAPTVPTIYTETTALTLTSNKVATASETFTFSGANLGETAVTLVLASAVDGLTLSESSVTPTAGAIADTEITVSYKSLLDVAETDVNLYLKQGDDILKTIVLTYSSTAGIEDLTSISAATTWNWDGAADAAFGTLDQNAMIVLANADVTWDAGFNALAIAGKLQHYYRDSKYAQGHELKFNTTVPGRVYVTYSNTGNNAARTVNINGTKGTNSSSNNKAADIVTDNALVSAGDVLIKGIQVSDDAANMLRYYKVEFVPTYTVAYAVGEHGSGTMTDANAYIAGEEVTLLPNTFAPESGYVWSGWVVTKTASGDPVSVTDGKFNMPGEAVTVTAQWDDASKVAVIVETSAKYESLADAVAAATDGQTIQLLQNNNVTAQVEVAGKAITLDLAGYKIEYTGTSTLPSGVILVHNGATLTIDDSSDPDAGSIVSGEKAYAAIALTKAGDDAANPAVLVINGGIFTGYYYGITGNGSRPNTQITINGGTITATATNDNLGIYHPQDGTLTVNGGTITAYASAIEMRAGTLVINDGSFTATATTYSCNPNGSGTTTVGAAIAIAQHTTKTDISVTIKGGTFEGEKAINESNPQANDPAPQVDFAVTGGDFTGEVSTVDVDHFISGGTFNAPVAQENCAVGYVPSPQDPGTGKYGVSPKDGTSLIKAVATAKSQDIEGANLTGVFKGAAHIETSDDYKMDTKKYFMVQLVAGQNFQAGDIVKINVYAENDCNGFTIYSDIESDGNFIPANLIIDTHDGTGAAAKVSAGINEVKLPEAFAGSNKLYVGRASGADKYLNAGINQVEVVRIQNPQLAAISIDTRDGVIDEANKTVAVQIPYESDLAALTVVPTIVWNEAAASNSIVVNDGSAWTLGDNTYKLTDKDGDYTVYTITLTRDVQKFVVTYFDGETNLGTEEVEKDGHPTATGIVAPTKKGKIFLGWNQSSTATAAEDLNDITITVAKNLYAIYEDIDCSGTGVKFSMTPKANELTENYEPKGDEERDYAEYATLVGGKVFINNVDASNKRISVLKETSHIKLEGGDDGYIHVELDCPLNEKDTIKIENDQKWKVSVAKGSGYVAKAKADKYHVVPAAWDGKYDFYIKRDGSSLTISGIQVVRPAKFDVSFNMMGHGTQIADIEDVLEGSKISAPTAPTDEDYSFAGWYKENTLENEWKFDVDVVEANTTLYAKWLDKSDATLKSLKYGSTEIELQAGVYTYNVSLPAFTSAVPALTAETSNPSATKVIANAAAFDSEGNATSTVTVTPEVGADQVYYVNFAKGVEILLQDVTGSITWNFANAVTGTVNITGTPQVLANYGGVTNDNTFESDKLEASGEKFSAGTKANLRANYIHFHTTVPGMLTISYSNTGGNTARYIYVNGAKYDEDGSANTTPKGADNKVFVPAGDVELVMKDGEDASKNVQIYQMIFNATPDYTRDVTEGRYGTICLPKAGVMTGADIFEIAYYGETSQKVFLDNIINGEMEAGRPYIFLPKEGATQLAVFYTDEANASAGSHNGLIGFIGAAADEYFDIPAGEGNYILQNNLYREVLAGAHARILSNRAYIKLSAINPHETALAPGRRRISMSVYSEQVATGIENTGFESEAPRKVLINGELFIIRGEKMYDAKGQLVK